MSLTAPNAPRAAMMIVSASRARAARAASATAAGAEAVDSVKTSFPRRTWRSARAYSTSFPRATDSSESAAICPAKRMSMSRRIRFASSVSVRAT